MSSIGPDGFAPTRSARVVEGYVSPVGEGGAGGLGSDVGVYILAEPLLGVAPIVLGEPLTAADIGQAFVTVGYGHTTHQKTGIGPKMGGQAPLRAISGSPFAPSFPSFDDFYAEWVRLEGAAPESAARAELQSLYGAQLLDGYEAHMGGTNEGFNTCNGDSGGPWLTRRPDGTYALRGVTSTGLEGPVFKCGFGTGVATFGPVTRSMMDALITSPCLDLPAAGVCEDNDVVRCVRSGNIAPQVGRVNCGMLGQVCRMRSGSAQCVDGATCDDALTKCGVACVDTQTDVTNCGTCGTSCTAPEGGVSRCTAGRCRAECPSGGLLCGFGATARCVNGATDIANCGVCGRACTTTIPGATATCITGQCSGECQPGKRLCTAPKSGCFDIRTDVDNCGSCGTKCVAPKGGTVACVEGQCAPACPPGQDRCPTATDPIGECRDLKSAPLSCGACGKRCSSRPGAPAACTAGACQATCDSPLATCSKGSFDLCTDLRRDAMNCGRCGGECPSVLNADATCVGGACSWACRPGFTNAMDSERRYYCANLKTDRQNCGRVGNECKFVTGGASSCVDGKCLATCDDRGMTACTSFNPITGTPSLQCQDLASSGSHCGACGNACRDPLFGNGFAYCVNSACTLRCNPGFRAQGNTCVR